MIMMVALICMLIPTAAQRAEAVGSKNIQAGDRAFLEWHNTNASAGIPRQTTIRAYANVGEQIFIGSSAIGQGTNGDVRYYGPDGTTGVCSAQGAGVGLIANYAQEQAGTIYDNAAGFVPCVISATQTTAAGAGIWDFEFISPAPGSSTINNDPVPIGATDPTWTEDITKWTTAAWHVSVRTGANAEITGRVFARYLAYNMGLNGRSLDAEYWIMTNDGYVYRIDTNGLDPYGFIFFANAEGIIDARGNPIYRSMQQVNNVLPDPYKIHKPSDRDDIAQGNITYKIFFENPNTDLPETAREYVRSTTPPQTSNTWLRLTTPVPPPIPQNFAFTGVEGTPGQAGTSPLGGYFTFDLSQAASYQISIDVNGNGVYTDPVDRILIGRASTGSNSVFWDTLDGLGAIIPAGTLNIRASIQTNVGEVHFPFVDAENNPNGIQLTRIRGDGSEPINALTYYNDAYNYVRSSAYNYSPCATGDSPAPPTGSCFGTASTPRTALLGVPSTTGAHAWRVSFGDTRVIDTWTYFPSGSVPLSTVITLAEADLSITKSHSPNPFIPGKPVTYIVTVTNAGPSAALNSRVTDSVPVEVLNTTWACSAPTGQGICNQASGIGNMIDTTVDLQPGGVATFTINGILSPSATGSLVNTAQVRRTNDTTDLNPNNNIATDIAPIVVVADLELNKTINAPPQSAAGSQVTFTITLRNRGPSAATTVEVKEELPTGLAFVAALASKGSYNSTSGLWTVDFMAVDEVATLTLTTTWDGSAVTNMAQVSHSDQTDPDSAPDNGISSEDDQASASLPLQVADLKLTKRVNVGQVNVGSNVIFTIDVTNQGPDTATGVRVTDELPIGLALVRATPSQGTYAPSTATWDIGSLTAGATVSLQIEATVLGVGPFTNSAQVSGSDQYDPDSKPNNDNPGEDDQGLASVSGQLADLSLSKGVNNAQPLYGEIIVYTLTLRNAGPSSATGVVVNDKLPSGLVYLSSTPSQGTYNDTTGDWTIGSVPTDTSVTLDIRAEVRSVTEIRNSAQVSRSDQPDPDSTPDNGNPSEDDQAGIVLTPQSADLSLTKAVAPGAVNVGGQATFRITVTNAGPSMATGVEVSEQLPAGLQYVSHSHTPLNRGAYNPSTGIWMIGTLNDQESVILDLVVKVTGVGPYENTAEISKSDQPDPDSTPGNGVTGEDDQSSARVGGIMADLSVIKRVNSATLPPDGIVTFTIEVRNSGPNPATGVLVGERLPNGMTVISAVETKNGYNTTTDEWNVGNLAVGEVATLTLTVQLTGNGSFVNVAEVIDSNQFDPDSTPDNNASDEDDQSSALVGPAMAPAEADLELTKTVVSLSKLKDSAAFLISVVNQGPDTATNVEVSEQLPAGLVFVSAAPSQGSYNSTTGNWFIGTIANKQTVTLQILTLVLNTSQSITNVAQVSRSDQPDPDSLPGNGIGGEDDQDSVTFSQVTPVTLTSLKAERQEKGVLVSWATGAELNSLGFHIYRSSTGSRSDAVRITPTLILAQGGASSGASYSFLDANAVAETSYSYWLVELSSGGISEEFGPVSPTSLSAGPYKLYLPIMFQ